MQLWTWQSPSFSLLDGCVDHSKSEYLDPSEYDRAETLKTAYRELWRRIGSDQIIWCSTVPQKWQHYGNNDRVEWVLDVPERQIICFMDDIIWSYVRGDPCGPPHRLEVQWRQEAIKLFPYDPIRRQEYCDQKEREFRGRQPETGDWWDELFVECRAEEDVSAIIPHPVEVDWVISNPLENR